MKKFTIIFLLLATTISSVQAGAYVGVGCGANILSGKSSLVASDNVGAQMPIDRTGLRDTTKSAEIIIGYGYIWNLLYAGIEANYSLLQAKSVLTTRNGGQNELLKTKLGNGHGISARCGYCINDASMIYLRFGWEARKILIDFSDNNGVYIPIHKKYRANAFAPGIGTEIKLNKNFAFRLEGKGEFYREKSINITRGARDYTRIKTKPRLYNLTAAITYTF